MKSTSLIDDICEALLQVSALLKEILTIAKEFDNECTFVYVLDVLLLEERDWTANISYWMIQAIYI